ncbi:MAG: ABC transporter substrate-binding protein [Burkholderiales bacterium]|nr:ABC transporter substrate-binding protein [Burkholderiales bacterium]MDE2077588.1 ABC transporter substrate-binding protein [Burkholderiales bacterium]MDE2431577.1 ABC transporter substrate-binding protein [Burkholderiales bacterium]
MGATVSAPLWAADQAVPAAVVVPANAPADVFVKAITNDVFATVRGDKAIQAGDLRKVIAVIDAKILPHVDFERMTASAVGRSWRQATPEQRKRLQDEFKNLLLYTYAGAAAQIKDQTVEYRPLRARPDDTEVVVRSIVRGQGDPIQIDYRMEKVGSTWKVYDVNVLGAWLVQTYQSSFAQEVSASGIDGLINKLVERNKQLAAKKAG